MDIPRLLEGKIEAELGKQKVIMLYGSRRTGKTTIIEHIAARHGNGVLLLQGEDMQVNSSPLQSRNDIGQLWEQYILSERIKFNSYRGHHPQYFFWRT